MHLIPNEYYPTTLEQIHTRIQNIDPVRYAKTRNYLRGHVTYLSPYLTHGVITTAEVCESILSRHTFQQCEKLIFELAWREFFHHVWQHKKGAIFEDMEHSQRAETDQLPTAVARATTGMYAIDDCIDELTTSGMMHNHARMGTASLVTNVARTCWKTGASWMYYHLLDGDLASNTLSWQWVAGTFSNKRYVFNQDNVNKYANSNQKNTFLDVDYEDLPLSAVPDALQATMTPSYKTFDPSPYPIQAMTGESLCVHHLWNFSPTWRDQQSGHVLLIEPSILQQHPMSPTRMDWLIKLATSMVPDIKIMAGSFDAFKRKNPQTLHYMEYPLVSHWQGQQDERTWMFDLSYKYFKRFFAFWKSHQKRTF